MKYIIKWKFLFIFTLKQWFLFQFICKKAHNFNTSWKNTDIEKDKPHHIYEKIIFNVVNINTLTTALHWLIMYYVGYDATIAYIASSVATFIAFAVATIFK